MYKIIIFWDTFQHFETAIKEYEKRLGKDIELIKLKPSKRKNIAEIVWEETLILKEKLKKTKGFKILLFIEGNIISTEKLLELVEKNKQTYSDIVFIIGGAYGVDISLLENEINYKLSFSPMTFPHAMSYQILLEQIYRIEMIKKGSGYHH